MELYVGGDCDSPIILGAIRGADAIDFESGC